MLDDTFDRSGKLEPVHPDRLLSVPNAPATEPIPRDRLTTASARTIVIPGDGSRPILEPSHLVEGAWELKAQTPLLRGLAGRTAHTGETVARGSGPKTKRAARAGVAPPHVPPWVGRGYHPIMATSPRRSVQRRTRTGRVTEHEDSHVFNGESRTAIYPINYPECCICSIVVTTWAIPGGPPSIILGGTGFMVGPRLLMTSGHLRPREPRAAWEIRVSPGLYNGQSVFGAGFLSYASDFISFQSDPGNDLMLCRLYDPIGDTTGYFGAIPYVDAWEGQRAFAMCGYPFDAGQGGKLPVIELGIAVEDDDDGDDITLPDGNSWDTTQVETKADTASGASGSPIYSWFSDGGMYAIGANKGYEEDFDVSLTSISDDHEVASGGDGFVELIRWGRANWP